jgi:DNA replication protein DnaC/predicted transcriptional regulator
LRACRIVGSGVRWRMLRMDQVHVVRHKVLVEGRTQRSVARELGLARVTVRKYVDQAAPTRKLETAPRPRPVWDAVAERVQALLAESVRWTGGKQRLTATRLHELLLSATTLARDLVVAQTRALKLPVVARTFEALARQARDAHWPHEDYLHEVLTAEQASRHESVIRQRLREARFPEIKTLDTFDFTAAEGVSATQIHALARGEWVTAPENLIFAGPIGTGKTHLAIALGVEATKQKRRVLFTRAADLVRQLLEARDARELTRLQQRLLRVDVLIVDEVGFVPFERAGGELLFNLITDRYERRATVVTTNLAFAEWVTVFAGDEKLTTALLDRLAHHATVITTKGKSYRMRKRRSSGS